MTLQEIIETRQRYYLEIQVETLLDLPSLNERQWHAVHYMQFCILVAAEIFAESESPLQTCC